MSLLTPTPALLVFPRLLASPHQGCGAPQGKPMWGTLATPGGFLFVPGLVSNPRLSSQKAAKCGARREHRTGPQSTRVFNTVSLTGASPVAFPWACDPEQSSACGHGTWYMRILDWARWSRINCRGCRGSEGAEASQEQRWAVCGCTRSTAALASS